MIDGMQTHHISLCALLRLYLDPEELVVQLTPEQYQRVGDVLLGLIRDSDTITFPSLPQLLTTLEVPYLLPRPQKFCAVRCYR